MNPRPIPHPAASAHAWRPGFARRAEGFERVVEAARAWRRAPAPDGRAILGRLGAAILCGTPELNQGERWMLGFLASHLNAVALDDHAPFVWVSVGLAAKADDCTERSIRRRLEGLERKGFIVRHFNHANRPDGREAYDLGALLSRLEAMEAVYRAKRQAHREARAAQRCNVLTQLSAHGDNGVRLEQFDSKTSDSAPGSRAQEDRSGGPSFEALSAPRAQDTVTERRRFAGGRSSPSRNPVHRLQAELKAAVEACPTLAGWVSSSVLEDPLGATIEDRARIVAAAEALLPEPERNNGLTAEWCLRRHGVRTFAMLAAALTQADAKRPANHLFGWYATAPGSDHVDLLRRLTSAPRPYGAATAAAPVDRTPVVVGPGASDPVWLAITAELRQQVRPGAYGSWFGQIGFHGVANHVLSLSAPPTAAARLRSEYVSVIREAAEAAGIDVAKVAIVARATARPSPSSESRA